MVVPPVVGHEAERALLAATVRQAAAGRFRAVVLEGDAGTGKTTLHQEACENAGPDVLRLVGTCLPMTAVAVPLMGLRSALRGLPSERRPRLGGWEQGVRPSTASPEDVPAAPVPVAFDDWLVAETRRQPVVLVVDDLQWADAETLDVLMYVLAGPSDRRLALVLAVRSSEVGSAHPLRRWLADARRLPGVTELTIGPLSRDETAEQVAGVLGAPAHSSLVDAIHARSGGNPYFTRLLTAGLDAGARSLPPELPEQLTTAVGRSFADLSAESLRLLTALAVGGRRVEEPELTRMAGIAGVEDATTAVRGAVDAGLLGVGPDGSVWFRHPLQAEVLERDLLPEQRRRLRAAWAVAYERALEAHPHDAGLLEAVATHHALAGRAEPAYRFSLTAARAMHDAGDAVGRLRLLRQAARLRPEVPNAGEPLADLLRWVREGADEVADWEAEIQAVDDLLALLDAREAPLEVAVLGARRGLLCFMTGRGEHASDLERPVVLSEADRGSWQRLYVLAEYTHILLWDGSDDEAARVGDEMTALLDAIGGPGAGAGAADASVGARWPDRARAYALGAAAMLALHTGDGTRARRLAAQAAQLAVAAGDGMTLLDAAFWEANSFAYPSLPWIEVLARRRGQMEETGIPHAYIAWLSASEALASFLLGDPAGCAVRLRVALGADPGPAGDFLARLTAALLASWQGRQDEADAHLARAEELVRAVSFPAFQFDVAGATARIWGGDAEGAFTAALAGLRPEGINPTLCEWLAPLAARALADLAQAERDAGHDAVSQVARVAELRSEFPHVVSDVGVPSDDYRRMLAALDALYDAEVARATGAPDAGALWVAAVERLAGAGLPWEEAYSCWRASQAMLGAPPASGGVARREAAAMLRRGHALARRLGARPVVEGLEALARSARVSLAVVSSSRGGAQGGAGAGGLDLLTPREREVVAHVVAGRTYGEIARALFLSEKTVSSHISNILRKTGTSSRGELAQWAHRQGGSVDGSSGGAGAATDR